MDFNTDKTNFQNFILLGIFALLLVAVILILKPFFTVILWSSLLYILISPFYRKIVNKMNPSKKGFKTKKHLLSGLFAVGTMLIIAGLLFLLGSQLISQLISFLSDVETFIKENPDFFTESDIAIWIKQFLESNNIIFSWLENFDLRAQIITLVQNYSSKLFSFSTTLISGTGNFLVSFAFSVFILYFFYLDGNYLGSLLAKAIPINPIHVNKLMNKFIEVTRGLFSGYILVALYQGFVAFILMTIFGVEGSMLFSVILMFASFIPLFGAAIVWAPIGLIMCFTGPIWKGILFLILAAITISFLDNFLRPFFLKDRIKVHPLIIFFAILGGIQLFGMNGLLLGPLVIILFFTILDILSNNEKETSLADELRAAMFEEDDDDE